MKVKSINALDSGAMISARAAAISVEALDDAATACTCSWVGDTTAKLDNFPISNPACRAIDSDDGLAS